MGLTNLPLLDRSEIISALEHYEFTLARKKKELELKKNNYETGLPDHVKALFEHSIQSIDAELKWIQDFSLQQDSN